MPQISPISWILVVLMFTIMLMSIKSNLPSVSSKQSMLTKTGYKNKNMKW